MPAKNADHDLVRDALVADGWTITDDPLTLRVGACTLLSEPLGAGVVAGLGVPLILFDPDGREGLRWIR